MRDMLGHDIDFDYVNSCYFYTKKSAPLSVQHATESELEGMSLIESAVQAMQGTPAETKALRAYNRFLESLSNRYDVHNQGWKNIINFRFAAEPIYDPAIFEVLSTACAKKQQVEITYKKPGPGQVAMKRIIDPYCLTRVDSDWFVFAYDYGAKGDRTFIPGRVKAVALTGKTFKRPRSFTLKKRFENCFSIINGKEVHDVKVQFSPVVADYIREKRWGGLQSLTELPDGWVEVHLQVANLGEVQRWLMTYCGEAVILHPPQLDEMVAAAAQKILDTRARRHAQANQPAEPNVVPVPTQSNEEAA